LLIIDDLENINPLVLEHISGSSGGDVELGNRGTSNQRRQVSHEEKQSEIGPEYRPCGGQVSVRV